MIKKLINGVLFVRAFVRLAQDPNRLDMVFDLADRLEDGTAFAQVMERPEVKEFLQKVDSGASSTVHLNLASLSALPPGTLGRTVADWMIERGLNPESLTAKEVKQVSDHVENHIRTSHDLWHVVTGFNSDPAGEVGLQAFYLAQLRDPLALVIIAAASLNALFFDLGDTERRMDAITRGWQLGKQAKPLLGTNWESLWQTPIDELRRELNLEAGFAPGRPAAAVESMTEAKPKKSMNAAA